MLQSLVNISLVCFNLKEPLSLGLQDLVIFEEYLAVIFKTVSQGGLRYNVASWLSSDHIYGHNTVEAVLCLSHCFIAVDVFDQLLSCVQLFATPWTSAPQVSLSILFYYLPEFAQTHVLWVGDAIQPSHPLLPFSPPAFSLSQHQGLF